MSQTSPVSASAEVLIQRWMMDARNLDDEGNPVSLWFVVDGSIEEFKRDMEADAYEIRPLFAGSTISRPNHNTET